MKIVLIGAGSFVFSPTVLCDALDKHRIMGELALVDVNREAADLIAAVGCRMAAVLGIDCTVVGTDNRRDVLRDADFVILSAAPDAAGRWRMDYDILADAGMADQARECGGLGGMSYALRTISMALDICEDMAALCPKAMLLVVTNPMPQVVTAVNRFTDIRAYGFCNQSQGGPEGYEWLAGLVGRSHKQIDVVTAGLNHFSWLISIRDRETGEDLVSAVKAAIYAGKDRNYVLLQRWLDRYGAIATPGPAHAAEYLPFDPAAYYHSHPPFHGDAQERQTRKALLRAIASGDQDWREVFSHGSWEHPVDFAVALHRNVEIAFPMLNLSNRGYLTDIPEGRIVEVPVTVGNGTAQGVSVGALPGSLGALCRAVSDVHELVAEGASTGRREPLEAAVIHDPAIVDKDRALRVLDKLLAAHRDLLPRFAR